MVSVLFSSVLAYSRPSHPLVMNLDTVGCTFFNLRTLGELTHSSHPQPTVSALSHRSLGDGVGSTLGVSRVSLLLF